MLLQEELDLGEAGEQVGGGGGEGVRAEVEVTRGAGDDLVEAFWASGSQLGLGRRGAREDAPMKYLASARRTGSEGRSWPG